MRHFWTTAAVAALCAISAPGWAAPQLQYLQLVANKHVRHHVSSTHHKHTTKSSRKKASAKSSRHRARTRAERRAEARREQLASSSNVRRHHGRAAPSAIHSEGSGSVKVRRGDSLNAISDRTGVSMSELIRLNHLRKPYRLRAGAALKLPVRRYYKVESGDTLFSLARRFGVDADQLRSLNDISRGRELRSGQKLYLPADAKDTQAREAAPEPVRERRAARETESAPAPAARSQPEYRAPAPEYRPPAPTIVNPRPAAMPPPPGEAQGGFELSPNRPAATPAPPPAAAEARALPQAGAAPSASDIVAAGRGRFVWPIAGALISSFGTKDNGQRNDGVNISAALGAPVRAAADGEVVYAGDQVPTFGNLVLIKHDGGWVTAYAHMSRILVKNRDRVTQGEQIGEVGQSGSVVRPQLHFEIRYAASPKDKAAPVDPLLLLPAGEAALPTQK